jgi:hypothetical protein
MIRTFQLQFMCTVCVIMFTLEAALSQVNTEAFRNKSPKTEGFKCSGGANLSLIRGNSDFHLFDTNLRFDYLFPRYHSFLVSSFQKGQKSGEKFANSAFIHFRNVLRLKTILYFEVFAQMEFNDFLKLTRRQLVGSGLRVQAINKKDVLTTYLGMGAMIEKEDYSRDSDSDKLSLRSTNYANSTWTLNSHVRVVLTGYLQFDVNHPPDYRILLDGGFEISLNQLIQLKVTFKDRYDSEPLKGLQSNDFSLQNGFSFSLP